MTEIRCTRHGARAAWRCRGCGEALCPGCAFVHRTGAAELVACVRCRDVAEPITVHRRERRSFAARIPGALVYPFLPAPLLAVLFTGLALALLSYLGLLARLLGYAIQWTFLFSVLRQASRGVRTYDSAELGEEGLAVFVPAIRGFVGTAIVWVPGVVWFVLRLGATHDLAAGLLDPVLWLLLLAGVAYAPAALMHAAAGGRTLEMLNPVVIVSFIVRLGADYALAVGAIVLLGVLSIPLELAGALAAGLPVPVLSRVLGAAIPLLATTAMSRVMGVLLYVRGDALDYGAPGDYLEPVWPEAVPRGREPVLATVAVEPEPAPEPLELAPDPAPDPAPAAPQRATAAAAEPEPESEPGSEPEPERAPAAPAPPADPAAAIAAALAAGDVLGAADLFDAYRGPPGAIPPRALFAIAKAASEARRHPLSARALHAAGTGDDAAVAPNALLVLARVYERRLGRAAEARQVLEYLVARWPASDAASQARALLSPPATG